MESYWIWNYGDYEIFHCNLVNSRRQEYGADYPAFFKYYSVDQNVKIYADVDVEQEGCATLVLNGFGHWIIDGKRYPSDVKINISKGQHTIKVCVCNIKGLPAAFVQSDVLSTNGDWYTLNDKCEKIPVGYEKHYNTPDSNPEIFEFSYERKTPVSVKRQNGGWLYDFGKEVFGYLNISRVCSEDKIHVSYGESSEEALDTEYSILFEDISGLDTYKLRQRGFRYVYLTGTEKADVSMDLEYLPLEHRGSFKCDDEGINNLWNVCAYTLHLNTREVMTEAVKRDRWLWAGDFYQASKAYKYLFHDKEIIRRSLIGLRGKEPFDEHINTITDFSFYWVIALYEYYQTYKDKDFIKFIYPRVISLIEFCRQTRTNPEGFIIGKYNDWVFIDWADIDKNGAVCAEQILYIAALRATYRLSKDIGVDDVQYEHLANEMTDKVTKFFWCEEKGAFIDCYESGREHISRHANILAVLFDIATEHQRELITKKVILNDEIDKLTTPFYRGFELDVMGRLGNYDFIEETIRSYWMAMTENGATTIWEQFDPNVKGTERFEMYGNKYAKSLCHAWGAFPIYLLGRYFLGVSEVDGRIEVKPYLGTFGKMEGTVPLSDGKVFVRVTKNEICVKPNGADGTLVVNNNKYNLKNGEMFELNY